MDIKNPFVFVLIIYVFAGFVILLVAVFSINYVGSIPINDITTVNIGFLTASSIIFGFCGSSFIRFSDKMLDLKQKASDLAKELCDIYTKVKASKKLSALIIYFDSKVEYYGGTNSWGATGKAPEVIETAYQCIVRDFRWQFNLQKQFIYFYQVLPLLTLSTSIIFSLLAFVPNFSGIFIGIAVGSFVLTIPIILIGWYYSNKWINDFDDALFNIRQQIIGSTSCIPPHGYESPESSLAKMRIEKGEIISRGI